MLLSDFYSKPCAIHRFTSAYQTFVPPFAVRFSSHKRDGKLLAASDEDGFVTLLLCNKESGGDGQTFQQLLQLGADAWQSNLTPSLLLKLVWLLCSCRHLHGAEKVVCAHKCNL